MPPRSRQKGSKGKEKATDDPTVSPDKFGPLLIGIATRIAKIQQLGPGNVPMDSNHCHYEFVAGSDRDKAVSAGFTTARTAIARLVYPHTKPNDPNVTMPTQAPPDTRVIYIPERSRHLAKELDRKTLSPIHIGTIAIALRASPFVQFPPEEFANAVCAGAPAVRKMFEPFAHIILGAVPHVHIDAMLLYMLLFIDPADFVKTTEASGYWLEEAVWERRRLEALDELRSTEKDAEKGPARVRAEVRDERIDRDKTLKALRTNIRALLADRSQELGGEEESDTETVEPAEKGGDVKMKDVAD